MTQNLAALIVEKVKPVCVYENMAPPRATVWLDEVLAALEAAEPPEEIGMLKARVESLTTDNAALRRELAMGRALPAALEAAPHVTALRVLIVSGAVRGRTVEYSGEEALAMTDHLNAIETALAFAEAVAATLRAENERLRGALRKLIDHTHNCEKQLTEELHHADFCGESLPLTKARAALEGETK